LKRKKERGGDNDHLSSSVTVTATRLHESRSFRGPGVAGRQEGLEGDPSVDGRSVLEATSGADSSCFARIEMRLASVECPLLDRFVRDIILQSIRHAVR